ncbi:hypothetical protein [Clostridium sp. LP20]|uniref:hypothetical protein n=1 Tax=Clostridium sp. LP20 TaxID=3418665 RepID=UPI003EE4B71A
MTYFDELRNKLSGDFESGYNTRVANYEIKRKKDEEERQLYNNSLSSRLPTTNTQKTNLGVNPPSEVFGKESYEYFKKNHPDTPDGFFSGLGYALETPYRIPVINKIFGSASKTMGGEKAIAENAPMNMYKDTTGNKVVDKVAELGGNMLGLASFQGLTPGQNLLNVGDDIATRGANELGSKISNPLLNKITTGAVRGAIDNSVGEGLDNLRFKGGEEIGKDVLEGALGGALFGGTLGGASRGVEKIKNFSDNIEPLKNAPLVGAYNGENLRPSLDIKNPKSDGLKLPSLELPVNNIKKPKSLALDIERPKDNMSLEIPIGKDMYSEVTGPGQNLSMNKYNTMKNSHFMQGDDVQKVVDEVNGIYDIKANAQSYDRATKMLDEDMEGTIKRIRNNGIKSAEYSVASGLITNRLIQDARTNGDYGQLKEWLEYSRGEATNLGQTLQALSTWKRLSPEGTLMQMQKITDSAKESLSKRTTDKLKKELSNVKDKEMINEIMKKYDIPVWSDAEIAKLIDKSESIQNMSDGREKDIAVAQLKKALVEKIPSSNTEKYSAMQRMNLLLNPKTMIRNPLGNVVMGTLENVKDIPATAIDKVMSKFTGERTTGLPNLGEQLKGMKQGLKEVGEDYKLGINTSMSQGQYELPSTKAFKGNKGIVDKALSKAEDLTSTGLRLGDEPFYKAAYNDEVRRQMKLKGVTEVTDEIKEIAKRTAEDKTFQNSSGISDGAKMLQQGMNKIGNSMIGKVTSKNPFDSSFGIGNIVMPFIKTPANIMDKAVDYSPLGGIRGIVNLAKGIATDELDQRKVVDQLARGLTGSALIGAGALMAHEGVINGSGPKDKEAAALEKQSGKMPYSIKSGNVYNSIDWMQPAAIPLMIGADVYENIKGSKDIFSSFIEGAKTGGATLFNQSMLQGLSKLFGGYDSNAGNNMMEGLEQTAVNGLSQLVPFNSAMKAVNDVIDPNTRDTYSESNIGRGINGIKSKIPILSQGLTKKVDTLGNEQQKFYGDGALKMFNTLINPGKTSKFNPSKAEKIALDLYNDTGDVAQMPRVAPKSFTYKEKKNAPSLKISLTGEEKNQMQKYMGKETEKAFSSIPSGLSSEEKSKKMKDILEDVQEKAKLEILRKRGLKYYKK